MLRNRKTGLTVETKEDKSSSVNKKVNEIISKKELEQLAINHDFELIEILAQAKKLSLSGEYIQALIVYDRALKTHPCHVDMLYGRGIVLSFLKRYVEALSSYDAALALSPDHAKIHHNRGVVLSYLGRHKEALQSYDRSLAINPSDALALQARGAALYALQRYSKALVTFNFALKVHPNHMGMLFNRSNVFFALDQYREGLLDQYRGTLAGRPVEKTCSIAVQESKQGEVNDLLFSMNELKLN